MCVRGKLRWLAHSTQSGLTKMGLVEELRQADSAQRARAIADRYMGIQSAEALMDLRTRLLKQLKSPARVALEVESQPLEEGVRIVAACVAREGKLVFVERAPLRTNDAVWDWCAVCGVAAAFLTAAWCAWKSF